MSLFYVVQTAELRVAARYHELNFSA